MLLTSGGRAGFLSVFERTPKPQAPHRPCLTHSNVLRKHHLLHLRYYYLRITFWEGGGGRKCGQLQPAAGEETQRWRGKDYPCRCQFERWGPLCGRRRGRGSLRMAPSPSSCRRAGGRTPHSTSSRPALLLPRGHKSVASPGTGLGTRRGNGESQRPGDRRDMEILLSRDNRRWNDQATQQGQLGRQNNQGHLRGPQHLPVPGGGGAGKPGKGTA